MTKLSADMTKTDLMHYWFDEVWGKGNLNVINEMFGPQATATGVVSSHSLPRADMHELVQAIRALAVDIKVEFSHTMEQGDWLAVRTLIYAKRADNGAPVTINGQLFVHFDGTQIVESFSLFDFVALFEQLGQMPPDTLPICLTGQKLDWT
ncbi:ester cyclase [Pseudophaeobacter sp.]|uniref:ester cyclase n=1 Tax=Pseudophaeobacter sp. TaxID=1971739 RepID=UPI0040583705